MMALDNGSDQGPTIEDRQAELLAVHAKYLGPKTSMNGVTSHQGSGSPALQDHEIVTLCFHAQNSGKFQALWQGDTSGYASQSEADLALLSILAFYTQDRSQLERLFSQSSLRRDK